MRGIVVSLVLVVALAILGSLQVVSAATLDECAAQAARRIDLVARYSSAHPEAPGAIAAWDEASAGEALAVQTYGSDQTITVLVPVIAPTGSIAGYMGVDPQTAAWQWYVEAQPNWQPLTDEAEARAFLTTSAIRPPGAALAGLRLVEMPDRHFYWHTSWASNDGLTHEVFLDAWDPAGLFTERDRDRLLTAPLAGDAQALLDGARDEQTRAQAAADAAGSPSDPARASSDAAQTPADQSSAPMDERVPPPETRYPSEYDITSCPHYYQNTSYNCGPASLCMLFDYWEMPILQNEVRQAANCRPSIGSYGNDLRRAGHFSHLSTAIQNPNLHGYTPRPYGYASMECTWSSGSHYTTRYSDLKTLVSGDIPILILTWYDSSHSSGHFRVVKGYSDPLNVFIVHDPWYSPPYYGPNVNFNQEFLVDNLWVYSSRWGMTSQPWTFTTTLPDSVVPGETFTVNVEVAYPGMHPFEGAYMTSSPQATIALSSGLTFAHGETATKPLPDVRTSGTTDSVSWLLVAPDEAGTAGFGLYASGIVTGSSYSYSAYEDEIGGVDTCFVRVQIDPSEIAQSDAAGTPLLALEPAGPNPFRTSADLRLRLAREEHVRVSIHDASGRVVAVLLDAGLAPGTHALAWSGNDDAGVRVAPGLYFARLRTGKGASEQCRLVLVD